MAIHHNHQGTIIIGADEAAINAQCVVLGIPLAFPPVVETDPRKAALDAFNALPDVVRTPFLPAWVIINQLLDLGGNADAVAYFDTLTIPQGFEAQAADIRSKLLLI